MLNKFPIILVLNLVLIFTLILGSFSVSAAIIETSIPENSSRLRVVGNAVISAAPDTAHITLGVETSDRSADQAAQENAERMARVLAALKTLGLTDSEISTSGYNIYSYDQTFNRNTAEETTITTYNVQNRINVTTNDLDQVGKIVDVAVKAGVNQIQGVRFDLADKQELQLQALKNAIKQAKGKAKAMAESAEIILGGIATITEDYGTYAPMNDTMVFKAQESRGAGTSINPSDIEVSAKVTMEFWF